MKAIRICWILLEAVMISAFLAFGSSGALGLAIVLILIPLCGIPVNMYVRKKLQIEILTEPNLGKGRTGQFKVTLVNPTVFPVMFVGCRIRTENQLNRNVQMVSVQTWIGTKKSQQVELCTGSDYCGRLRIAVSKVMLYDVFGLVGINCKADTVGHTTVQPDTFETLISLNHNISVMDDCDTYSDYCPGNDLTETYQIRDYVPGDSMRQIHWKLSGKFDRLIVRDPALPITRNVLVFWERTGESGDLDMIDAQAEIVVSLCKSLLDHSVQFTVGWNDTDRNLCILHTIQDMDELVGIIPRLMRATGTTEGVSGAELLLQTSAHALCAHMVYLAERPQEGLAELERFGHVTVLMGEDGTCGHGILFDAEHYKEQLSFLDL